MKIFVSYSRRDAGDFANQIQRHLSSFKYDIFTDIDSIRAGDIWSNTITTNISSCDIFVVIVTYGALQSQHVENEVSQAKRENKKIIPCFFRAISTSKIKWGLENIQGVEFEDKYELGRNLYSKIDIENFIPGDKDAKTIFEPSSTPTENTNNTSRTNSSYPIQSDNKTSQQKRHTNNYIQSEVQAPKSPIGLKIIVPIMGVIATILLVVIVFVNPFGSDIPSNTTTSSNQTNNIATKPPPPNSPPIASDKSVTTSFNSPLNIALEATDENVDDEQTATIVTQPENGSLGTIDQTNSTLTYTPNKDFEGTDKFEYKVNDGTVDSKNAVVTVTINGPPYSPPKTVNRSLTTSFNSPVDIVLEATDDNGNRDKLTPLIVSNPTNGTLGKIDPNTNKVTYTPKQGFEGTDTFEYKVNDGTADSNNAVVIVTVSGPANVAPIASDRSVTTSFNSPVDITLEATDENVDDELTATIVTQPEHGS